MGEELPAGCTSGINCNIRSPQIWIPEERLPGYWLQPPAICQREIIWMLLEKFRSKNASQVMRKRQWLGQVVTPGPILPACRLNPAEVACQKRAIRRLDGSRSAFVPQPIGNKPTLNLPLSFVTNTSALREPKQRCHEGEPNAKTDAGRHSPDQIRTLFSAQSETMANRSNSDRQAQSSQHGIAPSGNLATPR